MNRMNYYLKMLDACIHEREEDAKASWDYLLTHNYFLGIVSGLKKAKVMFSNFFEREPVFDHEKNFNNLDVDEFEKLIDEKYYFDDLLVFMRYKYDYETEWDYSKQLFLFEGDDIGHVWQNDWDEGQQDVEILGFMKIDDVPFLFYSEEW